MARKSSGNIYDNNIKSLHGPWGDNQSLNHGPYGGKDNIQLSTNFPNEKSVKTIEKPERKL